MVRPGSYSSISLTGITVSIVANGVTINGGDGVPAVGVGDLASLDLEGATLTGTTGSSVAALYCGTLDHISVARLYSVNVTGNVAGIYGPACDLTVLDSTSSNNGSGVVSGATVFFPQGSSLRLERSRIFGNTKGGVEVNGAQFTILNNFIAGNGETGGSGSIYGGVYLSGGPGGTFAFNTVTGNVNYDSGVLSGIYCQAPGTFTSNISWGNGGTADVNGNCAWQNSNIGVGGPSGNGNISQNPLFVSPAAPIYNLHLQSGSPCRNLGTTSGFPAVDIDRETRPSQGAPEMGADELP